MKKWTIQKRLLLLVLAAGILSFLTLSGLSFYTMGVVRDSMDELAERVGKAGATFTENLMTYQFKQTLGELAKARADFINHETEIISRDVESLADIMTRISTHPEEYRPLKLLDPRVENVKNFEPYIIYSPESYLNGMTPENLPPEIQDEIARAANIRLMLVPLSKTFNNFRSSFYVGSKNGWFICISVFPRNMGTLPFEQEEIYQYDCRQRPWYKNAITAGKVVFSDLYTNNSIDEFQLIGCSAPYYDASGNVAGVVGLDISNAEIYESIDETGVGENGFSFVLNGKGEVILSSQTSGELIAKVGKGDLRKSSEKTLSDAAKKMVEGKLGIMPVVVDGEEYFLAFAPMKSIGWSFGTLTPRKDIVAAAEKSRSYFLSQVNVFGVRLQSEYFLLTFAALILLVWLLYVFFTASKELSMRFVKPINELSDGVREIAGGNLNKSLEIHTGDEIEHLASCFNAMTQELKASLAKTTKATAEKERIATELNVAKEIQNGMLPKDFPTRSDFELFAKMTPAKAVGGDFYDFYFLDETHLAITVADVSGKGIPAALFMVISKTILNNFAVSNLHLDGLAAVVEEANDKLCANNDAMMFVTAFVGVLDLDTGEFTFVNAGHNPPVIYHAEENSCEFLDVKKNFVMGPMDGIPFVEQKISFKAGDLIFIYTDGVTEALNVNNEEYLPDRLLAFMNSTDCRVDLQTLLKEIRDDVSKHVGEAEQSDDITMFALRFNGGDNQ